MCCNLIIVVIKSLRTIQATYFLQSLNFLLSLPGITFSLDFLVVADHSVICVYIYRRELMFHRASMPWPQQKKGLGDKKTPDEKAVKGTNKTRQSFISLLTSSLVYQCVSEK